MNIFISHYHEDDEQVTKLTERLQERANFDIRSSTVNKDNSIPSKNSKEIKETLRGKITWAGTVIVAIGKQTSEREWVNWEIEEAAQMGKNIIGVYLYGQQDSEIPEGVEKYANTIVGWNSIEKINAAIEGRNLGNAPNVFGDIRRHACT